MPPYRPKRKTRMPWWLLAIVLIGLILLWAIVSDATYNQIFTALSGGLITTLWVSLVAFVLGFLVVALWNQGRQNGADGTAAASLVVVAPPGSSYAA